MLTNRLLLATLFSSFTIAQSYNLQHLNLLKSGQNNLSNFDLSYANLKKYDFSGKDLSGANVTGACLMNATFKNTKLTGAILDRAWLQGAEFDNACLCSVSAKNTNFSKAVIKNSCFMHVNVSGAILKQTDLRTSMTDYTNFSVAEDIYGMKISQRSQIPTRVLLVRLIDLLISQDKEHIPTPEKINNFENAKLTVPENIPVQRQCVICLENFNDQEKLACLPCKHLFHKDCANSALSYKAHGLTHPRCPLCRHDVKEGYCSYTYKKQEEKKED